MLWLQTGCFLAKLVSSAWKRQTEVQQRYLQKIVIELEIAKLTNNILPFSLMFYIAVQLLQFHIFG